VGLVSNEPTIIPSVLNIFSSCTYVNRKKNLCIINLYNVVHKITNGACLNLHKMGIMKSKLASRYYSIIVRFNGYMEKSSYNLMQTKLYYGTVWLTSTIARVFLWTSCMSNFNIIH
jgi:hypothetical protein